MPGVAPASEREGFWSWKPQGHRTPSGTSAGTGRWAKSQTLGSGPLDVLESVHHYHRSLTVLCEALAELS
jgi:hypothetical protein